MIAANTQPKLKRIEDLSLREIDMAYSLSRTGWSCAEIGRRYGVSESEVGRMIDGYVELHEWHKANPLNQVQKATPAPEPVTRKSRKRRADAIYATSKDRQAAYRARLKQTRHEDTDQLSPIEGNDVTVPSCEEENEPLQLLDEKA
jgi:hypothetical protein